tara:strand:- start:10599 stop:11048 length:450 start_codon:yes stop_codon:yes gene_type:complete
MSRSVAVEMTGGERQQQPNCVACSAVSLYYFIKIIHVSCAVLTFSGFTLRAYWMLVESDYLQHKISRVLPHLIDTVLLLSGITLVIMSRQYPTLVNWVTIKIGLLLLYIVLGSFAIKRGRTRQIRIVCLAGALLTTAAIFAVANLKISY